MLPLYLGVARVDVQVGAQRRVIASGFSNMICSVVEPSAAVARRQQALAEVGAENRIPRRAEVDRDAEPGIGCQAPSIRVVASPGLLEEQIEPVLLEDVQRIRAARPSPARRTGRRTPGTP